MQPTIFVLSDEEINQIAAGEVIDGPPSVVKELIENALDAGATKIIVEVTGGGLKLIRISDDGEGMHAVDARASIIRHATSKITKAADLFRIGTKGFRGEALASIASISKMTMISAQEDAVGVKLEIERGEIVKEIPCARTQGTTVEIHSLFYNVPARKKFQKSAAAIVAEIFRVVTLMNLSHPHVGFELISNGRKTIQTFPLKGEFDEIFVQRTQELLGDEFIAGSFSLHFKEGPLEFYGILGAPTNTRTNKTGQYLFLNGRCVVCDPIYEAVRAGYGTRLEEKRHPNFLLYLNVPSDLVDVNVHPQKRTVRLRKEDLFREKVAEAVIKALGKKGDPAARIQENHRAFTPLEMSFEEVQLRFEEEKLPEEQELFKTPEAFEAMGQCGKFLFLKDVSEDRVAIVDAIASRFRLLFERMASIERSSVESQGLLVPFSIDLTSVEAAMVLTHQAAIEKLGFGFRPIGKETFLVEAIPSFIEEKEVKPLIVECADALQEFIGKIDYEKLRQEKLALITAAHAKSQTQFSKEEIKHLYRELLGCSSPWHCPKGNPTMVYVNHDAIQELFDAHQASPKPC